MNSLENLSVAIWASGSGSNAEVIIEKLRERYGSKAPTFYILTNRKKAFVRERAERLGCEQVYFHTTEITGSTQVLDWLKNKKIDFIVLAGFLHLVPKQIIQAFPDRIVNIHPALLPNYGGKGMYGQFVHQAVREAGDKKSGITIHYVNEKYDEGEVILQATVKIDHEDSADIIAKKVLSLEHRYYPEVIDHLLINLD
jgi:phosphoribosylglycinamide formyltransferase-1